MSLEDKQAELAALKEMKESTGELVNYLESMAERFKEMNEATTVVSDVLTRWSELFALASVRDSSNLVLVDDASMPVAVAPGAASAAGISPIEEDRTEDDEKRRK